MVKPMTGIATKIPAIRNGIRAPSKSTLMARRGTQPIGEVFRIMNEKVIVAVRMTVLKLKLFFWSKKK